MAHEKVIVQEEAHTCASWWRKTLHPTWLRFLAIVARIVDRVCLFLNPLTFLCALSASCREEKWKGLVWPTTFHNAPSCFRINLFKRHKRVVKGMTILISPTFQRTQLLQRDQTVKGFELTYVSSDPFTVASLWRRCKGWNVGAIIIREVPRWTD